jgi:hypothetical protein
MKNRCKFLLILLLLCSFKSFGQTIGDNCDLAISLGNSLDTCTGNITATRTESWYSFVGMQPSVTIKLTNHSSSPGHYHKMVLYKGSCGSLVPIDSTLIPTGDSVLTLSTSYLPVGILYSVKAMQLSAGGCPSCVNPTVTSDFCIKQEGGFPFCGFDFSTGVHPTPTTNTPALNMQEQYIYNYVHSHTSIAGPFTIPVVVHVLHLGDAYGTGNNISYDQIRWQIAALNAAYQHAYATYNQQGYGEDLFSYGHQDNSSNPQVRFCLAHIGRDSLLNEIPFYYNTMSADTECGVRRYDLTQAPYNTIPNATWLNEYDITSTSDEQALMDVTRPAGEFPNDMYFNIYLVPDMCPGGGQCDSLISTTPSIVGIGFMMPSTITGRLDGVVFRSDVFGDNSVVGNNFPLFAPLNQGKIMDHEAGHFLSLWHTFQPDSTTNALGCYGTNDSLASTNQCDQHGDFCCDTPPDTTAFVQACPPLYNYYNSCHETYFPPSYTDHFDIIEDYMDYMDDECYNTFTFDQSMRMSAMLDVGGPRHSLVTASNLALTGVSNTGNCSCCMLVANITPLNDTSCVGANISFFTPSGVGLCATTWSWMFPGGSPSTGTGTTPSTSYAAPGTYTVILTASDGTNSITDSTTITVIVPTVTILHTNTTDTVCSGTQQNIYLSFTGNLPPYNVMICNQNNNVVATMNNINCDSAIVLVPVSDTSNVFHICSATNGLGCNVDTIIGTTSFLTIECCPNLFKDGAFEDYGVPGCNIFPSTTQQLQSLTCNLYSPSYYGIYNPTSSYGSWPVVPGNNGINGMSMAIDGWSAPIDSNIVPFHSELWCQAVPLEQGTHYSIQFDYSGHYAGLGSNNPPVPSYLQLYLQLKINGAFIGSPVHVPYNSNGTPWHTFVMDYTCNLPTGMDTICLCQVEAPPVWDRNFNGGAFDYMIDNMTIRAKDIPTVDAGLDTLICPGGIAMIGSMLNDSNGVYTWSPATFVTCDTCFYTSANPDSTYQYVLMNQQSGCIVRDTVVVTVLYVSLGNDTAFCDNDSITLIPTVTGNAGSLTYLWQPGAQTTSSITVSPTSPTTYIVTVTDTVSGCSDSDTLLVSPTNLIVTLSDTTICGGDSITLSPTVTGNIGGLSYLWLPGNETTPTISVSPSVMTTYSVIVSDSAGCSDTAVAVVTPDNISVSLSNATICPGDSTTLTPTITGGYSPFTYSWSPGSQTTSTITVSPSVTTIYSFTVTDSIGCSRIAHDTVTVSPSPTVTVSAAPASICYGGSSTLTASGASTYVWMPGSLTGSSVSVSPGVTTTYTVTGTNGSGCTDTAQITIIVNPLPTVTVTGFPITICSGSSSTLTASGALTYVWNPGSLTGNPVTVSPTVTTTYTVIGTNSNGCSDSAMIVIKILPAPTVTAVSADSSICSGGSATLTASGAVTYVWNPGSIFGNPVTVSPTATTSYTVTGTASNGCTATATITVVVDTNCCPAAYYAPSALNNFSITGSTMAVNQNLTFTGVNTINATDVRIYSNVTITVNTGATLKIVNKAHLHACKNMWQGIVVQPGGHLIMDNNVFVEDAFVAIQETSPTSTTSVQLDSTIFNKNQIVFLAQTWTGTLNFQMRNCRVTCRVLPASPTVSLLTAAFLTAQTPTNMIAPLTTKRSFNGIQVVNGGLINVGTIVGRPNIFDYLDHGIIANNTDVKVRNNRFQNMLQLCSGPPTCPNTAGIAIMASDPGLIVGNISTYNTITIGGSVPAGNTFHNCYRSIDITKYVNTTITQNTIFSASTVLTPPNFANLNGDHGIFIRTAYSQIMKVDSNLIRNQATGIHVMLTAGGLGNYTINLNDNVVKAGASSTTFTNTGIQVEGVTGVFFLINEFLNISRDSVLLANTCIQVRNIRNNVQIVNNPELFIRPITTSAVGPNQAGILVQNCGSSTSGASLILDNRRIHSTGTTYANINHRNVRGIYVVNSLGFTVCNNVMHHTGQCLVFEGSCTGTTMRKNDMSLAFDGFVLRNGGVIGQQGNATHPIDNRWLGGFVFSQTFTDNTFGCNINSPIWVRPAPAFWNPASNGSNVADPYVPLPVPFAFVAASCPATPIILNQQALDQQIAQNQINYSVYPPESRVMIRKRLWKELQQNPSLLVGDTILQNFYANNQYGNLGLMNDVEDQSAQGNTSAAISSNAGIVPITNAEFNQQQFNGLFLSTLMVGIDSLSAQQISDLMTIAQQCPSEGGDAVWQARAMLDWALRTSLDFSDSCSSSSSRLAENKHISDEYKVYPNPNAGLITVEYKLENVTSGRFEVLDLSGRLLFSTSLDPNGSRKEIQLPEMANGAYFYRIIGDAELKDAGTLIISR